MDYTALVVLYPAVSVFTEFQLNEILKKKEVLLCGDTIQIVPTGTSLGSDYRVIKHKKTEEWYKLIYLKWGKVVSELLSEKDMLKYIPKTKLVYYKKNLQHYRLFDVLDRDEVEFAITNNWITDKQSIREPQNRDNVGIKIVEKTFYDVC